MGTDSDTDLTSGWLPRALARTGHLVRAAELAYTISGELKQGDELVALVKAAASAGELADAQALAESIPAPQLRDEALVALVPAWARAGERDKAVALAESIRFPHNWARAWAMLAKAFADNGDTDGALRCAARADDEVRAFVFEGTGHVLVLLMEVAAATGDHVRAAEFADRVEDFSRARDRNPWSRCGPLAAALASEALRGDLERIDALLRPSPRAATEEDRLCGRALDAAADQGADLEADLGVRGRVPEPLLSAHDMACVLDAVAETADQDVALALADRAEVLLANSDSPAHDSLLSAVTLLLARRAQVERAMSLADRIDADRRAGRHAEIVRELARSGDTGAAGALACAINDLRARARALIEVVRELARRGDTAAAEALARTIADHWAQGEAMVAVVQELARRGDPDRAEARAHSIAYRATRARALAALAEVAEPSRARRLSAQIVLLDGWQAALPVLERIVPRSGAVVVDQMMIRDEM